MQAVTQALQGKLEQLQQQRAADAARWQQQLAWLPSTSDSSESLPEQGGPAWPVTGGGSALHPGGGGSRSSGSSSDGGAASASPPGSRAASPFAAQQQQQQQGSQASLFAAPTLADKLQLAKLLDGWQPQQPTGLPSQQLTGPERAVARVVNALAASLNGGAESSAPPEGMQGDWTQGQQSTGGGGGATHMQAGAGGGGASSSSDSSSSSDGDEAFAASVRSVSRACSVVMGRQGSGMSDAVAAAASSPRASRVGAHDPLQHSQHPQQMHPQLHQQPSQQQAQPQGQQPAPPLLLPLHQPQPQLRPAAPSSIAAAASPSLRPPSHPREEQAAGGQALGGGAAQPPGSVVSSSLPGSPRGSGMGTSDAPWAVHAMLSQRHGSLSRLGSPRLADLQPQQQPAQPPSVQEWQQQQLLLTAARGGRLSRASSLCSIATGSDWQRSCTSSPTANLVEAAAAVRANSGVELSPRPAAPSGLMAVEASRLSVCTARSVGDVVATFAARALCLRALKALRQHVAWLRAKQASRAGLDDWTWLVPRLSRVWRCGQQSMACFHGVLRRRSAGCR